MTTTTATKLASDIIVGDTIVIQVQDAHTDERSTELLPVTEAKLIQSKNDWQKQRSPEGFAEFCHDDRFDSDLRHRSIYPLGQALEILR